MLDSYRNPNHMNVYPLMPRKADVPQTVTSESGRQADPPSETVAVPAPADAYTSFQVRFWSEPKSHGDGLSC